LDVKTVCLGLLTFGEATGYDLKKHFEASIDHFFSTGFGSIYPALNALLEEGLVTCTSVPQEGRPDRKVYRITPAGEAALRATLATCEPTHKTRSELLALFYFAHLVPPERLRQLVDERIESMQRAFESLQHTSCPAEHQWPPSVTFVQGFGAALLEAAVRYTRTHRHLLEGVPQHASKQPAQGSGRVGRRSIA
jgi:PadR family transcriptional regulator, regulatory protein AphA